MALGDRIHVIAGTNPRQMEKNMTQHSAKPVQSVEVQPLGRALATTMLLVKTNDVEVTQVIVPTGTGIPTHEARGETVLHCLVGRVLLTAVREQHELRAGQLLYLLINEPFSIHGMQDSSLLLTIILPKQGPNVEFIGG
jgi:quercetin dioxygenase-like cupin family protein